MGSIGICLYNRAMDQYSYIVGGWILAGAQCLSLQLFGHSEQIVDAWVQILAAAPGISERI